MCFHAIPKAGECFKLALDFDAENPAALINQEYNRELRAGHSGVLKRSEEVEKLIRTGNEQIAGQKKLIAEVEHSKKSASHERSLLATFEALLKQHERLFVLHLL